MTLALTILAVWFALLIAIVLRLLLRPTVQVTGFGASNVVRLADYEQARAGESHPCAGRGGWA